MIQREKRQHGKLKEKAAAEAAPVDAADVPADNGSKPEEANEESASE